MTIHFRDFEAFLLPWGISYMRPQCMQCFCPLLIVKFAANGTRRYLNNKGETAQDVPFKRPVARMPLDADPQHGNTVSRIFDVPSANETEARVKHCIHGGRVTDTLPRGSPENPLPGEKSAATIHRE